MRADRPAKSGEASGQGAAAPSEGNAAWLSSPPMAHSRGRSRHSGLQSPRRPKAREERLPVRAVFTRTGSIAEAIEAHIQATTSSIDAALYRFNSRRLSKALREAKARGVAVRLIVDRGKFEDSEATRDLLSDAPFRFRITQGRNGARSKMHHKFVLLDNRTVLTGSYNWTFASEERNYENLLILQDHLLVDLYRGEFDSLWTSAEEVEESESRH
jgi:phosphatidylserine/phosphatidylglycerophosphate/cardiolipin synthase-like enzyme